MHQGVKVCPERTTNILTVTDMTKMRPDGAVNFALERVLDFIVPTYLKAKEL
ncbi:hypothetical protein LC605_09170 [Nostoc sp. CHAB 5836]|uniref:hypothetical protein n=1 Tax=Nostoc sp. CHAB 5836 TaxID=2780404 RepID=UPI001E499058|nr:hypothetical protein [Nostoc sp. CHAB 5836]MCC5615241.1 hypothetical protein [Nostoc sp. CHAB 5836]